MTRKVDPKSKDGFSVKAKGESEKQMIHDLKQLAFQDDIELSELVFEGINYVFKVHHWPPGNPQLILPTFQNGKPVEVPKCKCGRIATTEGFHVASAKDFVFCKKCFSEIPQRHDVKLWRWRNI